MATYDVDTDGGGSYSTQAAAIADLPATPTEEDTITCEGSAVDTAHVDISGFTRTVTDPLNIEGDGTYTLTLSSNGECIAVGSPYVNIDGLNVNYNNTWNDSEGIQLGNAADNCIISRNRVQHTQSGTDCNGILASSSANDNTYIANICIDWTGSGLALNGNGGLAEHNTAHGCGVGVASASWNYLDANNNACIGNTTDFSISGDGNNSDNNASTDSSAFGGSPITTVPNTDATFTDVSEDDFHVADTDSDLYHAGANLAVTTDLDGETYHSTTPSVGAYEFIAAAGGTANPKGPFTHPLYGPFRGPIT